MDGGAVNQTSPLPETETKKIAPNSFLWGRMRLKTRQRSGAEIPAEEETLKTERIPEGKPTDGDGDAIVEDPQPEVDSSATPQKTEKPSMTNSADLSLDDEEDDRIVVLFSRSGNRTSSKGFLIEPPFSDDDGIAPDAVTESPSPMPWEERHRGGQTAPVPCFEIRTRARSLESIPPKRVVLRGNSLTDVESDGEDDQQFCSLFDSDDNYEGIPLRRTEAFTNIKC